MTAGKANCTLATTEHVPPGRAGAEGEGRHNSTLQIPQVCWGRQVPWHSMSWPADLGAGHKSAQTQMLLDALEDSEKPNVLVSPRPQPGLHMVQKALKHSAASPKFCVSPARDVGLRWGPAPHHPTNLPACIGGLRMVLAHPKGFLAPWGCPAPCQLMSPIHPTATHPTGLLMAPEALCKPPHVAA